MAFSPSVFIDLLALYVIAMIWHNMRGSGNGETQKLFRSMLAVAAVMLLSDAACWQLDGWAFAGCRELIIALSTLLFLSQALYFLLWLRYEIIWVYGRIQMNPRIWTALSIIPLAAVLLLMLKNLWAQSVFTVNADCRYFRGDDYFLVVSAIFIYVIWALMIAVVGAVRAKNTQQRGSCLSIIQFISLQIIGTASEIFAFDITIAAPIITLGLLMIYLNVQQQTATHQQLVIAKQKQELTEKQIAIMLSQIQPHFLYNALNTIQNLCRKDPQRAVTAVGDFADYLRGNLDSLDQRGLIRFEKELEHIRTYCSLELLRFDHVRVCYDLSATSFALPALTVQPLVENAIRYGVSKKLTPGTVEIATRETPDAYIISVADDGVGFDPAAAQQDGRSHIGLENVRGRLAAQCAGTLHIESSPGHGTTATITIPKGGASL